LLPDRPSKPKSNRYAVWENTWGEPPDEPALKRCATNFWCLLVIRALGIKLVTRMESQRLMTRVANHVFTTDW